MTVFFFSQEVKFILQQVLFFSTTLIAMNEAAGRCGSLRSFLGMALKGHVFASAPSNNPNECFITCQHEKLCQSFNFMIKEHVCELNNRSKEAKPHEFVKDPERMYMTNGPTRSKVDLLLSFKKCDEIRQESWA